MNTFRIFLNRAGVCTVTLCALLSSGFSSDRTSEGIAAWTDDFEEALEQAQAEEKHILLNFTGSDWCVWCFRLRDEVFMQAPFIEYAEESLVLVEVDFPVKTELPEWVNAQNAALDAQFDVSGYPTIVVLASDGREIGRLDYMQGGAKTFVRAVKKLIRDDPGPPEP